MFKNFYSVFEYHIRYVMNDIKKPSKIIIINNDECMHEIFELIQYISLPINKG